MSYADLDPETRAVAEKVLTRRQFDVFRLWCSGAGTARIAVMLDISQSTARVHLQRAQQLIKIETERFHT